MKTEYFAFGGLDLLEADRRLDGMLTIVRVPTVVGGACAAMTSDLKRIRHALVTPGRSPSPIVCFTPSGVSTDADLHDPDGVADALETVRSFLDLPPSVLRLAVLDEARSSFAPLAFAQHVVFARRGASLSGRLLDYPGLREMVLRRTSDLNSASNDLSAEAMHASGLVDELFDGDPDAAAVAYVEVNERRRNGETGLYEAMRSARPSAPTDFRSEAARWIAAGA